MGGEVLDQSIAIVLPAARGKLKSEHALGGGVVSAWRVEEVATPAQVVDAPSREGARRLVDIGLGVSGVDADGVQFQDLAAVVLIQAVDQNAIHGPAGLRQVVVKVVEHRRMFGGGLEQGFELPHGVGSDGVALVGLDRIADEVVVDVDVEMVEPEVGERFLELVLRMNGANQLGVVEVVQVRLN